MEGMESPADPEELTELLETLSHQVRRETVRYFAENAQRTEATVTDIAAHIEEERSEFERHRVELSLYHTHLPKLADVGWIDFDPERRLVRYHDRDEAEAAIEAIR